MLPFERMEREPLVRRESDTNDKFGKPPGDRTVDELIELGVVNLDKPSGPTSHQVSAYVQGILQIKKSGHSGTLDPAVTGVLPVALERATRVVQTLLTAGKEYVGIMHLHKEVPNNDIHETCKAFVGKIRQLPPIKSSVKRQWRYRNVYYLEVLQVDGQDVLFRTGTQAGTYIRKLCHDIGEKLGVGAHMVQLRRTKAGPFKESDTVTLNDLEDAYHFWKSEHNEKFMRHCIKPVEVAVSHLPKIWVLDSAVDSLCHGRDLAVPGVAKADSLIQVDEDVAVMSLKDELIALGKAKMISKDVVGKGKGFAASIDKVFMNPGVYPRIQRA